MRESSGRRTATQSSSGRYVGYKIPQGKPATIALDATVRAAAPHQTKRSGELALQIEPQDIREKVLERTCGNVLLFVVDASGSMGARKRMSAVKGAVLSLLVDAYQKRDKVGLIVFRGAHADLVVPPTSSVELAELQMRQIPTGGKTPLAHGLSLGRDVLLREMMQNPTVKPLMIVVSDGRANVSISGGKPMEEVAGISRDIQSRKIPVLVLDSEEGFITLGFAQKLAGFLGAKYMKLEDLAYGQAGRGIL